MSRPPASGPQPIRLRLTANVARTRVRELAADSGNLIWTDHIRARMEERGIDTDDVLKILRTGDVETEPVEEKPGEWKIKLAWKLMTGRVAGVVTVLVANGKLVLVTTEWEDGR